MDIFEVVKDFLLSPVILGSRELPFTFFELIIEFVIPVAASFVMYRLLLAGFRKLISKSKLKDETKKNTIIWIRRVLGILIILIFFLLLGRLFGAEIFAYIKLFYQFLSKPFFESGSTKISFITIILAIPIFYFASWAARIIRNFFDRTVLNRLTLDEAKKFSISSVVRYGSLVIVLLVGLSVIGLDLSSLAVVFGALGIGIGFGLQNVISNFFSGVVIIFARPIKEGDRILIHESEGTVIQIRLINTIINTITNESIIVPNSQLINERVYNYSYDDRRIIIVNTVQVSYGTNLDHALDVLRDVGRRNPHGLKDMPVIVRVESFDDSGITLALLIWISDVDDKYDALSWNNLETWRMFKENGIEIPFPQMDLHIKRS